jgi:hypothetical protein
VTTSFEDILSKPARDIEAPKPLPVGTYLAQIEPQFEIKKMGKQNTDVIEYKLRILQPYDDVDMSSYPQGVTGITRRFRLWVTEDSQYRLKKFFIDTLGLDETKSISALIPEAVGLQLAVTIKHRPSEDGSTLYDEIDRTARA